MAEQEGATGGGTGFFAHLDELVASVELVVDRPKGSRHPRVPEAVYPVHYGYLEGTTGGDGDGADVFVGDASDMRRGRRFPDRRPAQAGRRGEDPAGLLPQEIEQVHHLLNDVLEIGGLLVPRR